MKELKKCAQERDSVKNNKVLTDNEKAVRLSQILAHGVPIEDLCLDFTLPGYPNILLIPKGQSIRYVLFSLQVLRWKMLMNMLLL